MSVAGQPGLRFMTTRWDLVRQAARSEEAAQLDALGQLLEHYCPALTEFLERHYRLAPEVAADTVQGFVLDRVLQRNLLAQARAERGRFRTFLLAALQNYLRDHWKHEQSARRRPVEGWCPLEESSVHEMSGSGADPAGAFDEVFARQVVADAIQRTYQHCVANELAAPWAVLHARVLAPLLEGATPADYAELAAELGLPDTASAQSHLGTGKRILRRQLEAVIREYADGPDAGADEWRELRRSLNQ